MQILDLLRDLGPWGWMALALVLIALETIIPGIHFAWFASAALVVGVLALVTGLPLSWQLVAFACLSVASLFWARRYARSNASTSDVPDLNVRAHQYVGRVVMVEQAITDGRGKVRVGDTVWQAHGADAAAGTRVRITAADGSVFVVEPVTG